MKKIEETFENLEENEENFKTYFVGFWLAKNWKHGLQYCNSKLSMSEDGKKSGNQCPKENEKKAESANNVISI